MWAPAKTQKRYYLLREERGAKGEESTIYLLRRIKNEETEQVECRDIYRGIVKGTGTGAARTMGESGGLIIV